MSQLHFKTTRKIVLKKIKVGTPIRTVTAGSFGINNLGGVNTSGRTSGTLLAFNQVSGNYEPVQITGDSNHFITFDSSSSPDTLQINFTNDSISGSLIPKLDSSFDLGSSTKKWRDLFLSGSTITLGDLTIASTGGGIEVKDSDGNVLLQNIKYISVNGDTDILSYDSGTSTFTFNDSDIARTDEIETFHKGVTFADSATFSSNVSVAGNLSITGDLSYDDVSADSAVFSGSVAIGNNLTADSATIPTIATTTINADQQFTDSATITNLANSVLTAKVITNTTLTNTNLTSDSATIGNVAVTTQLTGNQANFDSVASNTLHATAVSSQTLSADSGDIRQLSVDFINADSAFLDSATITNLSTTQITLSQMTLDSATVNNLNVDSSDIRQVSTEFINFDSAFGDSATITNIANSVLTGKTATLDSATITSLAVTNLLFPTTDSATITNIANTQLTGSQATLDSATITKLNVDSSDIDHLSTEAINFDSATGDSATITNIANSTLTAKVITNTTLVGDSATITNIANDVLTAKAITNTSQVGDSATITNIANSVLTAKVITNTTQVGDSATITNIANSVLTAKAITGTSADIDSATIGTLAVGTLNIDAIDIGDSASFTNLATAQLIGSQATLDSATVTKLNVDSADIDHFSTENINFDSATGDSATITNIANSVLTAKAITNTTLVGDSATITNIANDVLTAKAITNTTQVGDSATITNIANSVLTAKAITNTSQVGDSATITNIANSVLTAKAITNTTQVGDSATITNIANSVLTAKAITGTTVTTSGDIVSSGTIRVGNLNVDSADIIKISRDNLASGTGVTYDSSTGNISIGQSVGTSDSVTFSGLTIGGNLVVSGTTTTVATSNTTMTDQLFELGNGRTGSPSGDAGIVIEMGDDSNAFIGFDQSLGKFIVSRTNATGSSTGNLVHTTAPLVAGGLTADSANITQITGTLQTAAQTNVTSLGTLTALTVDDITMDGFTISQGSGNMRLDIDGTLFLDADTKIDLEDGGSTYGRFSMNSTSSKDFIVQSVQEDKDIFFKGNDGGSTFTALTLDMSDAGTAIFNHDVSLANNNSILKIGGGSPMQLTHDTNNGTITNSTGDLTLDVAGDIILDADGGDIRFKDAGTEIGALENSSSNLQIKASVQDKDIIFRGNDGGSGINALTLDMSEAGRATFNAGIMLPDNGKLTLGAGEDLQLYHDGSNSYIVDAGTGSLFLRGTNEVKIQSAIGNNFIQSTINAGTKIFFADGERFETTDSGVNVTGQLLADSATLTNLTVDSADIRQLSVDFINADSAFFDSATITTLAVGTLNIDNINIGDSATFTNVAVSTALNTNSLIVDTFTIDNATIETSGDMSLKAGGDDFNIINSSNTIAVIKTDNNDLTIQNNLNDKDFKLKGYDADGGGLITALQIDYSDAGRALFNGSIDIGGSNITKTGDLTLDMSGDIILDAGGENIKFHDDGTEVGQIDMGSQNLTIRSSVSDKDTIFVGNDGGSEIVGMTIDYSEGGRIGIGTGSPAQLLEVSGNGAKSRFTRTGSNGVVMEFVSGSTASGLINVASTGALGLGGGSRENDLTIDASGNVSASSLQVGNFNVDSADVIKIARDNLSSGSPDALTYDSAAGQFALNANHIMGLIKTVDSNGSGLNADTLEGQAGSHYRINVYNASGTLLN